MGFELVRRIAEYHTSSFRTSPSSPIPTIKPLYRNLTSEFRVWGAGFRVLGFGVQGSGLRV